MSKLDSLKDISSKLEKVSKTKKESQEKSAPLMLSKIGVDKLEIRELIDSANNGDINALSALGIRYLTGEDIDQDYVLAKKAFEKCCEENIPHAFFGLGLIYEYGYDVDIDLKKAYEYYNSGANLNSPECLYKKGLFLLNGMGTDQDVETAFNTFKQGASEKNPNCMFALGNMYEIGYGTTQNGKTALNYYHLASELGHEDATCTLAIKFIEGKSVEKNIAKAIELLESLANSDNADALYLLGSTYLAEESILNTDKAISYLKKASDLNSSGATYLLAHLYRDGFKHIDPNMLISRKYYKIAAEQGDINAKVEMTFFKRDNEGKWYFDHNAYNNDIDKYLKNYYNDINDSQDQTDTNSLENAENEITIEDNSNSEENIAVQTEEIENESREYRNLYDAETISLDSIKVSPEFDELIKPTDINDNK